MKLTVLFALFRFCEDVIKYRLLGIVSEFCIVIVFITVDLEMILCVCDVQVCHVTCMPDLPYLAPVVH